MKQNFDIVQRVIEFSLPIAPVPQGRPRLGKFRVFNPNRKELDQAAVLAKSAWGGRQIIDGPIQISVIFYMPIPVHLRRMRHSIENVYHSRKPDVDNLLKFVFDALRGTCFHDDSQLSKIVETPKVYSENPRIEIRIWPLQSRYVKPDFAQLSY